MPLLRHLVKGVIIFWKVNNCNLMIVIFRFASEILDGRMRDLEYTVAKVEIAFD